VISLNHLSRLFPIPLPCYLHIFIDFNFSSIFTFLFLSFPLTVCTSQLLFLFLYHKILSFFSSLFILSFPPALSTPSPSHLLFSFHSISFLYSTTQQREVGDRMTEEEKEETEQHHQCVRNIKYVHIIHLFILLLSSDVRV
jgi:hypothetical protein